MLYRNDVYLYRNDVYFLMYWVFGDTSMVTFLEEIKTWKFLRMTSYQTSRDDTVYGGVR